jgi:hypothetical protein
LKNWICSSGWGKISSNSAVKKMGGIMAWIYRGKFKRLRIGR